MNFSKIRLSDISLRCLIKTVVRNFWMVVAAAAILFMSVGLYFNWFHEPVYQANMTYAVTARRTSYTSSGNATAVTVRPAIRSAANAPPL